MYLSLNVLESIAERSSDEIDQGICQVYPITLSTLISVCIFSKQSFIHLHLHPNISMHILHTVLYTFPRHGADLKNLFNNQELL